MNQKYNIYYNVLMQKNDVGFDGQVIDTPSHSQIAISKIEKYLIILH